MPSASPIRVVDEVRATELPWLARELKQARVIVNVIGRIVEDFGDVVARLDDSAGLDGYELNVSCPNTRAGGLEFGADAASLTALVTRARAATRRPRLFAEASRRRWPTSASRRASPSTPAPTASVW